MGDGGGGGQGGQGRGGLGGSGGRGGVSGRGGAPGPNCSAGPTEPPFRCSPTYPQDPASLCTNPNWTAQTGSCGAFQATALHIGFSTTWCAYDQAGQLAWARYCDDVALMCSEPGMDFCRASPGAPAPVPGCNLQQRVCGGGGGAGGRGGSGGTGGGGTGGGGSGGVGGHGGTGGGAAGGSGQCGTQPPTGAPFNCLATYAEQSQANCALDGGGTAIATSGLCERYQQARITINGVYTVTCSYESGMLVWAERCEDSQVWCGTFCTVSAGAPTTRLSCALTPQCVGDAAVD